MAVGQTGGLRVDQITVLQNAVNNSTPVKVMNIMPFDFGTPISSGMYGPVVETAANDTMTQLSRAPLSALGAKLGITVIIAVNDRSNEVFGLADAHRAAFLLVRGTRQWHLRGLDASASHLQRPHAKSMGLLPRFRGVLDRLLVHGHPRVMVMSAAEAAGT